jgi:two-component sensor histidine kinase/PAS domain-containing protein
MSGEATWSEDTHLLMTRNGYDEDTWWTFSYSPLRDDDGRIAGFLDICTDSTAKVLNERSRQAERERLRESESRLRALITATSNIVFSMNPDWSVMQPLDGRGIVASAAEPMKDWIEVYLPEEDRAGFRAVLDAAIASKSLFEHEHRARRADGSIGWIYARAIPILDANGEITEWFGMSADVTERRRTEEHLRMVVNELNHRVRNNLAMVQSIAMQTFRRAEDPEQAATRFTERLVALARANDLLTGERWTGVDLRGVLSEAVSSHSEDPHSLVLDGPDVEVSAKSALALTLAAHELATNATKYGAWSVMDGTVTISWSVRTAPNGRFLCIEWKESGGPIVEPPTKRGFGSRLIERGLAAELDGKVVMDFQPEGLVCRIEARLKPAGEV